MADRIAIVGITGSGKSYLGRRIHKKTGLPLFHMDTLYWRGKWEEAPEAEYLIQHETILKENSQWVIEGWLNEKMINRLHAAELIIYLDYPGWVAAWRYLKRWLKHRSTARPELPKEARERFKFKWFVLGFFRNERPDIERALLNVDEGKVVRLASPKATEEYLSREGLV